MTTPQSKPLYALNAHLAHQALTIFVDDGYVPYTGTAQVRFSAAPDGSTTIAGCGPFALTASGVDVGTYYLAISLAIVALIVAAVPPGGLVYQVIESVSQPGLTDIQPLLVTAGRAPQ